MALKDQLIQDLQDIIQERDDRITQLEAGVVIVNPVASQVCSVELRGGGGGGGDALECDVCTCTVYVHVCVHACTCNVRVQVGLFDG